MKQPADNDLQNLVKMYLEGRYIMQLATVGGGSPWICTVHYAADQDFNIYWVSLINRRHSVDIAQNASAAVAVVVKAPEHPVIGIQMTGEAGVVEEEEEIKRAIGLYAKRHQAKQDFVDGVLSRSAPFRLYRFKPTEGVLFDEVDFPDNPRQVWLAKGNT